ncbi:helix-turn-helix domain-containing protein [Amycolatopsis halotolerans]|uniref:Helix-turn-helix domain-containing protein n=1 Tax=Amycolatopsis halotolerans TaxID=330083 RepID=A0ABV7QA23_9PSEU
MPGERLTREERLRIEAWLAEGLGYAEMARRLGRPTSTISREVARNSVVGVYAAGNAQETAGRRARLRKPARPAEPVHDGFPSASARGFVDEFAGLLAATGLPRMTARVFACLLISDGLTSADLVRRLRVSPASVSKSVGHLESMALVLRRPDPGGRRERYAVDDGAWLRAWQADTAAHGRIASAARRGIELFGPGTPAGARLGEMSRFFGRLSEQMGDSGLAEAVGYDALTVVAALVQAARPLGLDALSAALGWPRDRTRAAAEALRRRPVIADPLVVRVTGDQTYRLAVRADRLSPAQREALEK